MELKLEVGMFIVLNDDCKIWQVTERLDNGVIAVNPRRPTESYFVAFGDDIMKVESLLEYYDKSKTGQQVDT